MILVWRPGRSNRFSMEKDNIAMVSSSPIPEIYHYDLAGGLLKGSNGEKQGFPSSKSYSDFLITFAII